MLNKLFLSFAGLFFTLSLAGMEKNQSPLDLYIAAHNEKEGLSRDILNIAVQFKLLLAKESEAEKYVLTSGLLKDIENVQNKLEALTQALVNLYPHLSIKRSLDVLEKVQNSPILTSKE